MDDSSFTVGIQAQKSKKGKTNKTKKLGKREKRNIKERIKCRKIKRRMKETTN